MFVHLRVKSIQFGIPSGNPRFFILDTWGSPLKIATLDEIAQLSVYKVAQLTLDEVAQLTPDKMAQLTR